MIIKSAPGRIVVLSSTAHKHTPKGGIDFENINWDKNYSAWAAYGQSKLANLLFAKELNQRLQDAGVKVTVNAVHPGVINTDLGRHLNVFLSTIFYGLGYFFMKSIPQGAATTVYVATAKELEGKGGLYFADCNECEPSDYAKDKELAKKLWEWSEKVTGKTLTITKE